jgi:GlpG protein
MRQIGSLASEREARLVADYLLTQGIAAQTDRDDQQFALWVRDENQVPAARQILDEFLQNPDEPRYRSAASQAEQIRADRVRQTLRAARNTVDMRRVWNQPLSRRAPLVFALIGLSIFASLMTNFGNLQGAVYNALMFCDFRTLEATQDPLLQIKQGQLWRVITPIFLHGGWLHLLFNMSWLYYLGAQIEMRRGTVFLGGLALALAAVSNMAQYLIGGTPAFLGMSGVAYGLFSYVWIHQRIDPRGGYLLSDSAAFLMLLFLLLGFTPALSGVTGGAGVANWCHVGGLVTGAAVAWVERR